MHATCFTFSAWMDVSLLAMCAAALVALLSLWCRSAWSDHWILCILLGISFFVKDHRIPVAVLKLVRCYHVSVIRIFCALVFRRDKNTAASLVLSCMSCSNLELHFDAGHVQTTAVSIMEKEREPEGKNRSNLYGRTWNGEKRSNL